MSEKLEELLKLKSSGSYIPPAKLKKLMAHVTLKKDSEEYQQLQWESLKKSINGLVNKANKNNIKIVVTDLFRVNLIRGRGIIVKNLMKSQQVSIGYTDVYAALICVVNSKIPQVGKLLVTRLLMKYKRTFRREDVDQCKPTLVFLGKLVNFEVCNSTVVLQILSQLLENPTGFTVEMAIVLLLECGAFLLENLGNSLNSVFDRLRNILNEGLIDSRTQFLVEECLEMRRKEFSEKSGIVTELDLVEEEDRITHNIKLDDRLKSEDILDVFQYDKDYEKHEEEYNLLKKDILGDAEDEEEDDYYDDPSEDEGRSDASEKSDIEEEKVENKIKVQIKDLTQQELTSFQKTVYLTIMSSMGPEEAAHKLLKIAPIDPDNKEYMLIDMVIKCCAQEKTYAKYYGLIGENLAIINRHWAEAFNRVFKENYEMCHRFETALLRNIGTFWGHMLASDKLGWEILNIISLSEQDTTSSGRIFLKFMFLRMLEELGMKKLVYRVEEPYIREYLVGIFPEANIENLRFSINFFTAIGLGRLTERMRDTLENLPPDPSAENVNNDDSELEYERGRSRKEKYTTSTSVSGSRSGSYSSYSSYTGSSRESSRNGVSYSRSGSRSPSYSSRSYSRSRSRNSSGPLERSYSRSPDRRTAEPKAIPERVSRQTPPSRRNSFSRSPSPQQDYRTKRGRERSRSTTPTDTNRHFKRNVKRSRYDTTDDVYRSDPNYSSRNYGDGDDRNDYSSWNSPGSYSRRDESGRGTTGGRRGNVRPYRSRWNK